MKNQRNEEKQTVKTVKTGKANNAPAVKVEDKVLATREAKFNAAYTETALEATIELKRALESVFDKVSNGFFVDYYLSILNDETREAAENARRAGTLKAAKYAERAKRARDEVWAVWDEIAVLLDALPDEFAFCSSWAEDAKADDGTDTED